MAAQMATTALESPGWRIVRNVGAARGVVVRSRSLVGNFAAGLQTLFGGAISVYASLCGRTGADSDRMMCEHAVINGANAIVAMRYDANEILSGGAEAIRQGAAVVAEPER
jgi:uncharacterized protein YbjQ (UPF0145 family)